MTVTSLKSALFPALFLSGSLFALLTLPLAAFGSKAVAVQLEQDTVFVGQPKDIAVPYFGLATLFSLGAGLTTFSAIGWQKAHRRTDALQTQLTELRQQLQQRDEQIQALQLSEAHLKASGLDFFLKDDSVETQPQKRGTSSIPVAPSFDLEVQSVEMASETNLAPEEDFASIPLPEIPSSLNTSALSRIQELQQQLQRIVADVESLHSNLKEPEPTVVNFPQTTSPVALNDLNRRLNKLELQWARQKLAS